jgi:hypothetical protein
MKDSVDRPYQSPAEPPSFASPPSSQEDVIQIAYRCDTCAEYVDAAMLREVRVREGAADCIRACPKCGMAVREERSRVVRPFLGLLVGAFRWPLRRDVAFALFALGLMGFVCKLLFTSLGTPVAVIIAIMYLLAIVRTTGLGDERAPHAVDWVNATDLLRPAFRFYLAWSLAFIPVGLAQIGGGSLVMMSLGALLGMLYLPAGLILAAHSDGWLAPLNLLKATRLALRMPRNYLLTSVFVVVLTWIALAIFTLLELLYERTPMPMGIAVGIVFYVGWLVVPAIIARMLGILVREHVPEIDGRAP